MKRRPAGIAAILLAGTSIGVAQSASTQPMSGTNHKSLEFDVVSIREDRSVPDPVKNPIEFGVTPDGYRLKGLSIIFAISAAYIPSQGGDSVVFKPGQITGLPSSILNTRYDIDAKVSEADLPRWSNPVLQRPMLRAMLQAMLTERFKLAVHRDYQEKAIFELVLAKGGPKFKPSETTALTNFQQKHPDAQVHADIGGTMVAYAPDEMMFYDATIPAFCSYMSGHADRPIHDKTGLTGKYDITFRTELPPPPQPGASMDPSPDISTAMDQLGLKLEPAKDRVEILVIDHIERPSEN